MFFSILIIKQHGLLKRRAGSSVLMAISLKSEYLSMSDRLLSENWIQLLNNRPYSSPYLTLEQTVADSNPDL